MEEFRKQGRLVGIEGSELEIPPPGRNVELLKEIGRLGDIMEDGKQKALKRGEDPEFRAKSAGRRWSPGDGY